MLEHGEVKRVDTAELPWKPSTFAPDVYVKDVAVTELLQGGRRLGPGWASISTAGTIDADVHSDTGCVFVLVDRA